MGELAARGFVRPASLANLACAAASPYNSSGVVRSLTFKVVATLLVASFLVAALLFRRAPVAGGLVLTFVSSLFLIRFVQQRRSEAVVAAADRGDVEKLRSLAAKRSASRYEALVALALFEGADAVLSGPHRACVCGDDCGSILNVDVEAVLTALSQMQAGNPTEALTMLRTATSATSASDTFAVASKSLVRDALTCCLMIETDRLSNRAQVDKLLDGTLGGGRFLRGPLHLATVSWRMRRGDLPGARALLDALPVWKPGSRLAVKRDALARELRGQGVT
jgi:hypothetical protein